MSTTTETAISLAFKTEFVRGIQRAMKKQKVSQAELARRMRTSRAVVHRLLIVGSDVGVTLTTMSKAAAAVGCTLKVRVPALAA